jgi:hypothetical protein
LRAANDLLQSVETLQVFAASLETTDRRKFVSRMSDFQAWAVLSDTPERRFDKFDKGTARFFHDKLGLMAALQKAILE